ncbi:monosaccharide ABC transporter substrate-binding protein (CUT2 family) [Georgenia soli]|uniref:Monosaccharide ABC transporter substrate-binding protein (CUT2 family) n=1 Tax=Georgenia soli TaxID=638953 RepID=A0A2A9ER95_9MICO|nr:ABC transporter substrate-binding protein [Georgenia soli]PFG41051.1 monosaccharide ABC transporter substrate-binding protein (CUT2 family) [Georgenia soli]
MKTIKKRVLGAVSILAVSALTLTACGRGDASTDAADGASPEGGSGPYVAIVSKGFSQQFWVSVREGAEAAADELGARITFDGPDTESDVEQQIQQLQTAMNGNPDAIGFAALDSEASIPLIEQADADGIPIVAFDSGVESEIPVTTVATDNYAAAAEAAKHMVELAGGTGKVAVVAHDQTSLTGTQRRDGFVDYIEQNSDMEIVDIQYTNSDVLKATNVTNAFLQANPDLKGIFATNEASAIGMITAIDELGRKDGLTAIGFDSGKGQIDAIKDGRLDGAITQDPYNIGYRTVEAALAAIDGEEVEELVDTGFYFYDATNLEDEEIARSLYE